MDTAVTFDLHMELHGPALAERRGRVGIVAVPVPPFMQQLFPIRADLRAHAGLVPIETVPAAVAPVLRYSAAVTTLTWRPNPEACLDYLTGAEGQAILSAQGLEPAA